MENRKLASRISILTTTITLVGLLLLWIVIAFSTASMVRGDITNQMMNAVDSRAVIIDDYVTSAEEYLKVFALSGEVRDLLANPTDSELLRKAKQYRIDFSNVKGIFEGLYIADINTYVLTHCFGSNWNHDPKWKRSGDLSQYNSIHPRTYESGYYAVSGNWEYGNLYVLSNL